MVLEPWPGKIHNNASLVRSCRLKPAPQAARLRAIALVGGSDACSGFCALPEALLQSGQEEEDVFGAAGVAHEADAPGFAFEVAQAAADFDAEIGEEFFADDQVIDAGGNFHGVELGQLVAFGGEIFDAEGG